MSTLPGVIARVGDMHPARSLELFVEHDGDIVIRIQQGGFPIGYHPQSDSTPRSELHVAEVQFCTVGNGGGRSPRTREALLALIEAIKLDNAERPIAAEK